MANLRSIEIEQATYKALESVCTANFRSPALQIAYMVDKLYPSKEEAITPFKRPTVKQNAAEVSIPSLPPLLGPITQIPSGSLTLEQKGSFSYAIMLVAACAARQGTLITVDEVMKLYKTVHLTSAQPGPTSNALSNLKGSGFLTRIPDVSPLTYQVTHAGLCALEDDPRYIESKSTNLFALHL